MLAAHATALKMYSNMKIHIFSRSPWSEPKRLRQQLAVLLLKKYDVYYHTPLHLDGDTIAPDNQKIKLRNFRFINKFGSIPFISLLNAIFLSFYFKKTVEVGDVVFNFLPEAALIPRKKGVRVISVINDDFASMAPKLTSWWVKLMLETMAAGADSTLYVSTQIQKKYKSKNSVLFYPWADRVKPANHADQKNIILYWGYISIALDFDLIEKMAGQIIEHELDLNIMLVGPVDDGVADKISRITNKHSCVTLHTPRDLCEIETDRVLCGIEPISPDFHNGANVEFPNKGPRLLSYGIPLVYSGCKLLNEKYFIEYQGSLVETDRYIRENSELIAASIDEYFLKNSSEARLSTINTLIV